MINAYEDPVSDLLKYNPSNFRRKGLKLQILARGGLGNQLFQFSFIHGYASKFPKLDIGIIPDLEFLNSRSDCPFGLEPLLIHCNHVHIDNLNPSRSYNNLQLQLYRLRERILFRGFTNLIPVMSRKELHEKAPFAFSVPRRRLSRINLPINGYFQNWRFVENVWPAIEAEVKLTLAKYASQVNSLKSSGQEYIILHIRGGDYLSISDIYGVMSQTYYLKALEYAKKTTKNSFKLIIATNDNEFAISYMQSMGIKEYEILNPTEFTPWETLAIMADASGVICANSTLSWWGGFFCVKNGGFCTVPEPWIKTLGRNSAKSMRHPQFVSINQEL